MQMGTMDIYSNGLRYQLLVMSHGAEEELDFMGRFPLVKIGLGLESMAGRLGLTGSDGFCVKLFMKPNED